MIPINLFTYYDFPPVSHLEDLGKGFFTTNLRGRELFRDYFCFLTWSMGTRFITFSLITLPLSVIFIVIDGESEIP